jgi:hypothetical protein
LATKASPYAAVLDACVLFPAPLRDLLVQIATTGLYRAKWTDEIHDEWIGAVLDTRSDLVRAQLERTRELMNGAVLDCLVRGYDSLIPALSLPDPKDRHVLAAAIHARCDAIVTFNLKDFPASAIAPHDIEAIHPDDFIFNQIGLDQARVIASAFHCRSRLRHPPVSAEDYLDKLKSQGLPKTVAALSPYISIVDS